MRTVAIPIRTNQKLELFVEKRNDGFEFWAVGVVKGRRLIIDHHLTHVDLVTRLEYARPEDLIWCDASPSEIPAEKHKMAISMEETIEWGVFWETIIDHLSAIAFLDKDKKATNAAKKAIIGHGSDGVLNFSLEPNNKLIWSCADQQHWLSRRRGPVPDWWNLNSHWELHLVCNMNTPEACGMHVGVLHVDEKELHIKGGYQDRIASVFRRIS